MKNWDEARTELFTKEEIEESNKRIELDRAIEILTEKYNQAWNRNVDFKIGWALYETWREFAYENKTMPKEDN